MKLFIKTFRLRRPVAFLAVAVLAAGIGLIGAGLLTDRPSVPISTVAVTDNAGRIAFLGGFGWQVDEEPSEILEIVIPDQFDSVYEQYNQLQKKQGYDLTRWRGKTARRYTYRILNYPNAQDEVFANLILCDGQVIGGDVSSVALNGFMHGLIYEKQ